jgi:SAM-dependent methyltransferase
MSLSARSRFPVKRLVDGRALLNLGSSTHVAPGWNNIDFSWIIRLGRHRRLAAGLHRWGLLSQPRFERIQQLDPDTIVWNLRRGIPFPDGTFDVVYHSHLLEHIDRDAAPGFLRECLRVLRPGGLIRVVVPDLELLASEYLQHVEDFDRGDARANPSQAAEAIFDQMIVRTPKVRAEQRPIVRLAEALLIGNTGRNGVLHRWMYDRLSLANLLSEVGYANVVRQSATSSGVDGWKAFRLDTNADGSVYKPESLYMEGSRI